ncbi:MAG: serine hydrolase [Planctomycetes bacterium]|nr:serine hydrolase [Planctomycetota bacterium]
MRTSILLLLSLPLAGQANPHRDASLEDLVRASDQRLAVYAHNLDTDSKVSLNGVGERHLGSLTRVFVAAAALTEARRRGVGHSHVLPYPKTAYRGGGGVLRDRHGEPFTLGQLIEATIVHDDPAATDLLITWLGARLQAWVNGLGIDGLRPIASRVARDGFVLGQIDPRFGEVPAAAAQRWLHDGDTKAIVPSPFDADPRLRDDHVRRLGNAWASWYARRNNAGTLRGFADALFRLLCSDTLHRADRGLLARLLRSVPTVQNARDLGLHLVVHGLDTRSWRRATSAALIETPKGTVMVITQATGMVSEHDAAHLLSVMGEAALRRLAPGAWRTPEEEIPAALPSTLRQVQLRTPGSTRACTDFDVGGTAQLVVQAAPLQPTVLVVRWTRSGGSHRREARGFAGRKFTEGIFSLPLHRSGNYSVTLAIGGRRVWAGSFQARD